MKSRSTLASLLFKGLETNCKMDCWGRISSRWERSTEWKSKRTNEWKNKSNRRNKEQTNWTAEEMNERTDRTSWRTSTEDELNGKRSRMKNPRTDKETGLINERTNWTNPMSEKWREIKRKQWYYKIKKMNFKSIVRFIKAISYFVLLRSLGNIIIIAIINNI